MSERKKAPAQRSRSVCGRTGEVERLQHGTAPARECVRYELKLERLQAVVCTSRPSQSTVSQEHQRPRALRVLMRTCERQNLQLCERFAQETPAEAVQRALDGVPRDIEVRDRTRWRRAKRFCKRLEAAVFERHVYRHRRESRAERSA